MMNFLITAGGQGTKMWPMSSDTFPKQFQTILGEKSLYRAQIEMLLKAYSPEQIYVSTKERYLNFIKEQSPEVLDKNIIMEPDFAKNRGPGEGYAALKLAQISPDEPFMIIQSDCIRVPEENFYAMANTAYNLVRRDKKFFTTGQKAINPDMGCDYIQLGNKIADENGMEIFQIDKFIDRLGDYKQTVDLIQNYHVSTHTNHMCWYPQMLIEKYAVHRPDWHEALMKIKESFGKSNEKEITNQIYEQMESGSTEEVTKHVMSEGYLMLLPFRWYDIGSWSSVHDLVVKDGNSYIDGDILTHEVNNCFIKGIPGKRIGVLGVENLIIVDTPEGLLITTKEESVNVKKVGTSQV